MEPTAIKLRKKVENSFFELLNNSEIISSKDVTNKTDLKMILRNNLCNYEALNFSTKIKETSVTVNTAKKGLKFVICYFICSKKHTDNFVIEHKFITTSFTEAPLLGITTVYNEETILNLLTFPNANIPNLPLIKRERTIICLNGSYSHIYEAFNDFTTTNNQNIKLEKYYIDNNGYKNKLERLIYGMGPNIETVYAENNNQKVPIIVNKDINGQLYLTKLIRHINYIDDQEKLNRAIISALDKEADSILNSIDLIALRIKSAKIIRNLRLILKDNLYNFKRTN